MARVEVLERGYRVPAVVIDFASRLLPEIAPGVSAPEPARENPGLLDVVRSMDVRGATADAVTRALSLEGSVGVIVADRHATAVSFQLGEHRLDSAVLGMDGPAQRLTVVPAQLAKGLEYDHVVVVETADIVAAEPSEWVGLRRLYVVLTRAVSGLTVVHSRPLPAALSGAAA